MNRNILSEIMNDICFQIFGSLHTFLDIVSFSSAIIVVNYFLSSNRIFSSIIRFEATFPLFVKFWLILTHTKHHEENLDIWKRNVSDFVLA